MGVGRGIALTHDADIIHGDLTTSNFMLRSGSPNSVVCMVTQGQT
jgi:tRNA A-37 threonylcarbamoyl transferase component Bud32